MTLRGRQAGYAISNTLNKLKHKLSCYLATVYPTPTAATLFLLPASFICCLTRNQFKVSARNTSLAYAKVDQL